MNNVYFVGFKIGDKVCAIDTDSEDIKLVSFLDDEEIFPVVGDIVGINEDTYFIELVSDPKSRVVTVLKEDVIDINIGDTSFMRDIREID